MSTKIQFFGMISEKLKKESDWISIDNTTESVDLRKHFDNIYPELKNMTYKIAVNQELMDVVSSGVSINEIALLPPFAGG